ncbi:MAG: hypothetical protein R6W82_10435 [bacterium]
MRRIRLLLPPLAAAALLSAVPPAGAEQGGPLTARVDSLNDEGSYQQAMDLLLPALQRDPDDYALLWRASEVLANWGRITRQDEDLQEQRYEEAVAFARQAVAQDSTDAEGWFHLGKAVGRLALFRGGKTKVNMSKEVKEAFEEALAIEPDHPLALHGLARWHREVTNLSWFLKTAAKIIYGGLPPASNEQSVELFMEAIRLQPDNIAHRLELGKTYLEMDREEEAAASFRKVLELPATRTDDEEWKQEAEELLEKIRD